MTSPLMIPALLGLTAALSVARMELPEDFAAGAERTGFAGFGGRNNGSYTITDPAGRTWSGAFHRSESRLGVLDPLVVSRKGKGSFELTDAGSRLRLLEASCSFRKLTLNVDVVTFDSKKAAFACELSGAALAEPGRVVIGQPKREGMKEKLLAKDLRAGEAVAFGERLVLESVHAYAGSKFGSQPAVGYLLRAGDRVVAAVELTDVNPGIYFGTGLTDSELKAVLTAALAIAVYRDPAHSALED